MLETTKLLLTQFNEEALLISLALLGLTTLMLILVWFYNRKRFHQLAHHIPAGILQSYLDTIIQNSSALKSSLLRGGGAELTTSFTPPVTGTPSLYPASADSGANNELLNMKNAELSHLQGKLTEKEKIIRDLEAQIQKLSEQSGKSGSTSAESAGEMSKLQTQLSEAKKAEEHVKETLTLMTQERDEMRTKLQEYEIIEDDLANLKKLQTENEDLKIEIERLKAGGSAIPVVAAAVAAPAVAAVAEAVVAPPVAAPAPIPPPSDNPEVAAAVTGDFSTALAGEDTGEADMLAAMSGSSDPLPDMGIEEKKEDKSSEDLLSEFEKMLE